MPAVESPVSSNARMSLGSDPALPLIIVLSALISALLWTAGAALALYFIWRRSGRVRAADPEAAKAPTDPQAPLFYLLSAFFWPVALVCSVLFLREPSKAK